MIKKIIYIVLLLLLPYVIYYYGGTIEILSSDPIEIPPDPSPVQASLTIHNFVKLNEEFWVRTYDISLDYPLIKFKKSGIRQDELGELINQPKVKMLLGDLSPYIPELLPFQQ